MHAALSRWLGFRLADLHRGTTALKHLRRLRRSQWWPPEQLASYQAEKLHRLLRHAYDHVPYYHDAMHERGLTPDDFHTAADLAKLPVLTRCIAQRQIRRLWSDNLVRRHLSGGYTGGSTGEPLGIMRDRSCRSASQASYLRGLEWAGYTLGARMAVVWGAALRPTARQLRRRRFRDLLFNWASFDGFRVADPQVRADVERLRRIAPAFLRGYPSSLARLARHCLEHDITDIRPRGISTTAEVLLPHVRRQLHQAFGCPVFNQYGCNEVMGVAAECTAHHGLHVSPEHVVCEILHDGHPAAPGQTGELVLTDLDNYALVMIRCAPGDWATPIAEPCPCGRHLPLIGSIQGRTSDIIVGPSGEAAHGILFSRALAQLDWFWQYRVRQFQIVQTARDSLTIRLASKKTPDDPAVRQLESMLQDYLGAIHLRVEVCDEIEPGPAGKLHVCRSQIPADGAAPPAE